MPLLEEDRTVWRTFHDIDTATGAFAYDLVAAEIARTPGCGPETDAFEAIARQALGAGIGRRGAIGEGESHLFPARELHAFAQRWLEERFGATPAPAGAPAP
jgi:aminoglycoside 3-N-acetyltransferase